MSIRVPDIPNKIGSTSYHYSFSLIRINERRAAKIGPVVKLMQLDIDRGMYAIAAYCRVLETKLSTDRMNTMAMVFLLYLRKSKFVLLKSLPNR